MFDEIEKRKKLSVILFSISIVQLGSFLFLVDFSRAFHNTSSIIGGMRFFATVFPQAVGMPFLSILLYLASPWKIIYIIYLSIFAILFISGTTWTMILVTFFPYS